MEQLTFAVACKKFFGFKPDQKFGEFMTELRELTDQDRKDLIVMFKTVGIEVVENN